MNHRNLTLDALKGFGILLVVIGHLPTIYSGPIYRFHMALFFVISGWCFSEKYIESIPKYIWRRFVKILLPALLLVAFCKFLIAVNPDFWTRGIDKYYFLGTKWFLYDLFKSSVAMVFALFITKRYIPFLERYLTLVFLLAAHVASYMHYDSIAIVFWISSFVAFGYYLKQYHNTILTQMGGGKMGTIICFAFCSCLMFISSTWAPPHITFCDYTNYIIYAALSVVGILSALIFVNWLKESTIVCNILVTLGQHTLPIVLLQWPSFFVIDWLVMKDLVTFGSSDLEIIAKFFAGISIPLGVDYGYVKIKSGFRSIFKNKMTNKYLIRLDDACTTMDAAKWQRMEDILDRYGVRPMVGVIPHNEDPQTSPDPADETFWDKVHNWESKGWSIALHGYNHVCITNDGMKGLNPMWERSEFAGLPPEQQREKIHKGVAIFRENGINPNYFFAPSHTYDRNTLEALRLESDIRIISDTIATRPYRYGDFAIIPQLGGHCAEMKIPGIWTFCLHPTIMTDAQFKAVDDFLKIHKDEFISFSELDMTNLKGKTLMGKLLSWVYFTMRKLKGLK